MPPGLIITLDGPAGVGKSTLAKALADRFAIPVLDTGAMFRCTALRLGPEAAKLAPEELKQRLSDLSFGLSGSGAGATLTCNGSKPDNEIRNEDIGTLASTLAALAPVREFLKNEQRKIGRGHSLVAEGRDMGTVIFPNASGKFFLDAAPEVRAERRFRQLQDQGCKPKLSVLTQQILERDRQDRNRSLAPLRPAPDAIIVNTSHLSEAEVLEELVRHLKNKGFNPVRQ